MQIIKISLLALLSSYVAAQDIDDNDVPRECRTVCASVTQLTQQCDDQNNDDDSGYINCVCSGKNAARMIPACEACVANYDRNDGHDNDVNDLVRSCSLTNTAFNSASTTMSSITGSPATATGTSTANGAGGSASSAASSASSRASSIASSISSSVSNVVNSATASTSTPGATNSGNAANVNGAPILGVATALFSGALGFVGLA